MKELFQLPLRPEVSFKISGHTRKTNHGAVANQLFRRNFCNSKFFENARTSGYAYLSKNLESQKFLRKI